jgi:hybrid cluster-associated redox disulfide protein
MKAKTKEKKTVKKIKITKNMLISDIFENFPSKNIALSNIISEAGMHCIGCGVAEFETLEEGAMVHGMSNDELDNLIEDLNKAIN